MEVVGASGAQRSRLYSISMVPPPQQELQIPELHSTRRRFLMYRPQQVRRPTGYGRPYVNPAALLAGHAQAHPRAYCIVGKRGVVSRILSDRLSGRFILHSSSQGVCQQVLAGDACPQVHSFEPQEQNIESIGWLGSVASTPQPLYQYLAVRFTYSIRSRDSIRAGMGTRSTASLGWSSRRNCP